MRQNNVDTTKSVTNYIRKWVRVSSILISKYRPTSERLGYSSEQTDLFVEIKNKIRQNYPTESTVCFCYKFLFKNVE